MNGGVPLELSGFSIARAGATPEENEDAITWQLAGDNDCLMAVSDGAGETSFARMWAWLLVDSAAELTQPGSGDKVLEALQGQWCRAVGSKVLPWYAEEKAMKGAFATFLACRISRTEEGYDYTATAIGDSCLFHLRQGLVLDSYPLSDPREFDYRPFLVGARGPFPFEKQGLGKQGFLQPGDELWLVTDALARALLEQPHTLPVELAEIPFSNGSSAIEEMVQRLRAEKRIKNDDTSMVRLVTGA